MDGPTIIDRLARAIHAADMINGTPTTWGELGETGQDSYRADAKALLTTIPATGLEIKEHTE